MTDQASAISTRSNRRNDDMRITEIQKSVKELETRVYDNIEPALKEMRPTVKEIRTILEPLKRFFRAIHIILMPFAWIIKKSSQGAKVLLPIFALIGAFFIAIKDQIPKIIDWIFK